MASSTRVGNTFIEGIVQVLIILGRWKQITVTIVTDVLFLLLVCCLCPVFFNQCYPEVWCRPELKPQNNPAPFLQRWRSDCGQKGQKGRYLACPHAIEPDPVVGVEAISSLSNWCWMKAGTPYGGRRLLTVSTGTTRCRSLVRLCGEKEKRAVCCISVASNGLSCLSFELLQFVMMSPNWKMDFLVTENRSPLDCKSKLLESHTAAHCQAVWRRYAFACSWMQQ